jgi:hypothetical protein
VVVDGDMGELPAGSLTPAAGAALAFTIAVNAMDDGIETAELLDVDLNELSWRLALVARPGLLRLEG